ncbi:GSCFA domain-containing protein [Spongiimicrobium salis]|uniref:GSCFA domain-containing protein n=1 Tax=Spongiimicrobium salis TaxID=1667022 RepID=UPI00374C9BFD
MQLQTQIPLQQEAGQIDYGSQLLLLGSCFVTNIGEKLAYYKFQHTCNPFGILFHPLAIENVIERALAQKEYTEEETFLFNERWHCYDAHSELSAASQDVLVASLNQALKRIHEKIMEATHLCITLGTAWAYRNKETGGFVANCHKVPQKYFTKELVSVDKITASITGMLENIRKVNPKAQCIFTVSPVRHLKDGFVENQRSKGHLIVGLHQALENGNHTKNDHCSYFPSYEIMMDELRDYRFYAADMIHPNTVAIDYIWEKFKQVWISETAFPVMKEVRAIQKGLQHRPFNPETKQHQDFIRSIRTKIKRLQEEYAFLEFQG